MFEMKGLADDIERKPQNRHSQLLFRLVFEKAEGGFRMCEEPI